MPMTCATCKRKIGTGQSGCYKNDDDVVMLHYQGVKWEDTSKREEKRTFFSEKEDKKRTFFL